jgi:hypothetical protein
MKCIDNEKSYIIGAKVRPKGQPFEMSSSEFRRMSLTYPTLKEFGDEPVDSPVADDAIADPEPVPEMVEQDNAIDAVPVARYKGGGWYDLEGQSVRLAEVPKGTKIVRE